MRTMLIAGILFLCTSCSFFGEEETAIQEETKVIEVELNYPEEYAYNFAPIGDEDEFYIEKEPEFAEVSELNFVTNENRASLVYRYKPESESVTEDLAIITIKTGSNGESPNNTTIYTVFRFTIKSGE